MAFARTATVICGTGTPEGAITAPVGRAYLNESNGDLWTKTSGTGNTGWAIIGSGASPALLTRNRYTASHTLDLTDAGAVAEIDSASANNWTIPPNSSVAYPINTVIGGGQYGTGLTTVVAGSGVIIRSRGGLLASAGQYAQWTAHKIGTNEFWLTGDLA